MTEQIIIIALAPLLSSLVFLGVWEGGKWIIKRFKKEKLTNVTKDSKPFSFSKLHNVKRSKKGGRKWA